MDFVNIKINGMDYKVDSSFTILKAAQSAGIDIPTLCYLKEINAIGSCRVCVCEVKGARNLVAACVYPVNEGMEVFTSTPRVLKARKMTLELILSNHNRECTTCIRSQNCELQRLAKTYKVEDVRFGNPEELKSSKRESSTGVIVRDNSKCTLCRRCVAACKANQEVGVIGVNGRGFSTSIGCAFENELKEVACINCGQCTVVCPTGALHEHDQIDEVIDALHDETKHVVIGVAPSIRVHIGEFFGFPIGTNSQGKLAAALRRMGFNGVFDVDTAADLTIMEEGTEFLNRLANNGPFPIITSCSPGWVKFCETYYKDMIKNLSSCRSPQGMFGAVAKSYYAEKMGIDPKDIVVVTVMPCTAKKFEAARPEMTTNGERSIDISITSRELSRLIERFGIRFKSLPDEDFDAPFGIASGAGHIFGSTGGVTEAALRTVCEVTTGKPLEKLEFTEVRGKEGEIKEATYNLSGTEIKVAVTSGLSNAKKLLDSIQSGEKFYHFVEIMACPGGCVNGGGQPIWSADTMNFEDLHQMRSRGLYDLDANMSLRKSHESPAIKELYDIYFEKPGSHKAHHLLHTTYTPREKYSK